MCFYLLKRKSSLEPTTSVQFFVAYRMPQKFLNPDRICDLEQSKGRRPSSKRLQASFVAR